MALSRDELERRVTALREACRRSGIKLTHQRVEIFREVARSEEHPDVETIFRRVRKRLTTISLNTVYSNLQLLEKLGLLSRLESLCHRVRFDANTDAHHHFICSRCGSIRDFYSQEMDELRVPKEARSLGQVRSFHLLVRGICSKCRSNRD